VPRQPRFVLSDGSFHVFTRGVERRTIFEAERDYRIFLSLLDATTERCRWELHAACLMPNHFHLVLTSKRLDLSNGMRTLKGRYAAWFNHDRSRSGHLFGGRFRCIPIEEERYLETVWGYVLYNPVRAGLCQRPQDWPWTRSRYGFPGEPPAPSEDIAFSPIV
jgi:REP element-mobilizing transposase RayT